MRLAVFGAGAASVPFLVVEAFVWTRTGGYVGVAGLLGHGELFPPVAMLAGQGLAEAYALPRRVRVRTRWPAIVGGLWAVLALSCAMFTVPFSGASGSGTRVAASSVVLLGVLLWTSYEALKLR